MDIFEFRALTHPDHFIRHRSFLGELTTRSGPPEDFKFALVRRGDGGKVALRSVNFPQRCLRHANFRISLDAPGGPGDQLFLHDSTFVMVRGLADENGVSFRSLNFPDRFLRHRDFSLFLEPEDSPNLALDATFFRQRPAVIIDEG